MHESCQNLQDFFPWAEPPYDSFQREAEKTEDFRQSGDPTLEMESSTVTVSLFQKRKKWQLQ